MLPITDKFPKKLACQLSDLQFDEKLNSVQNLFILQKKTSEDSSIIFDSDNPKELGSIPLKLLNLPLPSKRGSSLTLRPVTYLSFRLALLYVPVCSLGLLSCLQQDRNFSTQKTSGNALSHLFQMMRVRIAVLNTASSSWRSHTSFLYQGNKRQMLHRRHLQNTALCTAECYQLLWFDVVAHLP